LKRNAQARLVAIEAEQRAVQEHVANIEAEQKSNKARLELFEFGIHKNFDQPVHQKLINLERRTKNTGWDTYLGTEQGFLWTPQTLVDRAKCPNTLFEESVKRLVTIKQLFKKHIEDLVEIECQICESFVKEIIRVRAKRHINAFAI